MLQSVRISLLGKNEIAREGLRQILTNEYFHIRDSVSDVAALVTSMREEANDGEAHVIIIDNSEDWLVLRFVKAEKALFLAFVFRWSDQAEEIMQRPYFSELLRVTDFMADGTSGRVLISAGAMNFMEDDIDAAFTLSSAGARRDDAAGIADKKRSEGLDHRWW